MAQRTSKPHFVPAAYLQFWDFEGKPKGRESRLWLCNGKVSKLVHVRNVAVQSGLYSTRNPNAAERYFGELERDWAKLVHQLRNGRPPRADILAALLLLQSSYFLLRNPKFRNSDSIERFDVYKSVIEGYWTQVLMNDRVPEKIEHAARQMLGTWTCHLLQAQTEPWIASDNPVLLLSIADVAPAIIFLPITPTWALLALKADVVTLKSRKITAQDTEYLNSCTAINSIRHIFSNRQFDSKEIDSFAKWLARRPNSDSWISRTAIHIQPFQYPVHGMKLGFL
jgi:hypothetical protein